MVLIHKTLKFGITHVVRDHIMENVSWGVRFDVTSSLDQIVTTHIEYRCLELILRQLEEKVNVLS